MSVRVEHGDCLDVMRQFAADGVRVDAIVCDPPYHLTTGKRGGSGIASLNVNSPAGRARISTGFMGKAWDGGGIAFDPETWRAAFDLLPPGGHLVAFGGTRTFHRMVCAIEDAGFEIRDQLAWVYGSGFPKSLDVGKAIDKAAGATRDIMSSGAAVKRMIPGADQDKTGSWVKDNGREFVPTITAPATDAARQWSGFGTALKPAFEPICLARKPLIGTVAANVQAHGTGAINIDGCRVESEGGVMRVGEASQDRRYTNNGSTNFAAKPGPRGGDPAGRWPANLVHDGSDEVLAAFPVLGVSSGGPSGRLGGEGIYGGFTHKARASEGGFGDSGSAARFFFSAKADSDDRADSRHPTVKPVSLMRWLVRLVTPPGGLVLDPFAGSGTLGVACIREGFDAILIEREAAYVADIRHRIAKLSGLDAPLFTGIVA
jgi:DNA modification methylase